MEDADKLLEEDLVADDPFAEAAWDEASGVAPEDPKPSRRRASSKPLRQRIEEYFERKRLQEQLDEDIEDNLFS